MKALKTVAVALGITLGCADRHPAPRAGRAVRLAQAHRGGRRGGARARAGRHLIDAPVLRGPDARRGSAVVQRPTPADPAGVSVSAAPRASARDRRLAEAGVLATVVMWSANFVIVKAAIGSIGPLTFTSARYVVAAVTLMLLVRWRLGPIRRPGAAELTMLGLGMLGFGGYQVLWTLGLTRITAGDSALIIAVAPVLTALLAAAVGLDRLTPPKLVGALLAFAGVTVVIAAGHELSLGASLVGDAADPGRRRGLGGLHGRGDREAAHDGAAGPDGVGGARRGARPPAARRLGRRDVAAGPRSLPRSSPRSSTRGRSPRASRTCSCSTRSGWSVRPGSARRSSSSRSGRCCSGRSCSTNPRGRPARGRGGHRPRRVAHPPPDGSCRRR